MDYTADDIVVSTAAEGIRRRPAMYVGKLGAEALTGLIENVLCAAVDEALVGDCRHIDVAIDGTGAISVKDDGPGMPVDLHPLTAKPFAEYLLTSLFACRAARRSHDVANRFCGEGIVVTNALSAWLELEIDRAGQHYSQRYKRGVPMGPLASTGTARRTGTCIRFLPDPEFFNGVVPDIDAIRSTLSEIQGMTNGLAVVLTKL